MARILVTDDDPSVRSFLKTGLDMADHEVFRALDAEEAIDALQSQAIDVLITDLQMPWMSGLELAEIVNRDYPNVKIIVITALATEGLGERGEIDAVLSKPFSLDAIKKAIEDVLS